MILDRWPSNASLNRSVEAQERLKVETNSTNEYRLNPCHTPLNSGG